MAVLPLALAALALVLSAVPTDARRIIYPLMKQCDPRWGNNMMGTPGNGEQNTICNEGCAMTSTTMAFAGLGVKGSDGKPINPGELNTWLQANGGYYCAAGDCNNLNLTAPERFSPVLAIIGETQKPSYEEIAQDIVAGSIAHVAHVRDNSHFVLLTAHVTLNGVRGFHVNDPYYNVSFYPYANISDIIRYKINKYPVYKQCDTRWGNNKMGSDNETICEVGCLMSSISMAIGGNRIRIPESNGDKVISDPATLNQWLRTHNGYTNYSALYESRIPEIDPARIVWPKDGMHTSNDISFFTIKSYLDRALPRIVIANVMHGQHFVLVVGYRADGDTLVVNDPGFDRNTYSYSNDVVGWRLFDMS